MIIFLYFQLLLFICVLGASYAAPQYTNFGGGARGAVYGAFNAARGGAGGYGAGRGAACRNEEIMITQKVCKIEWDEDCTTAKKKIGEKVVYDNVCADKEVNECKTVQIVYQDFPRWVPVKLKNNRTTRKETF